MDGAGHRSLGQIRPTLRRPEAAQDALIAELDLERLYAHGLRLVRYEPCHPIPR